MGRKYSIDVHAIPNNTPSSKKREMLVQLLCVPRDGDDVQAFAFDARDADELADTNRNQDASYVVKVRGYNNFDGEDE